LLESVEGIKCVPCPVPPLPVPCCGYDTWPCSGGATARNTSSFSTSNTCALGSYT